jgi:hypothetical protein
MISVGVRRGGEQLIIDAIRVAEMFDKPNDAKALVQDFIDYAYTLDVSADQKEHMESILTSGLSASYWTTAWDDYKADPSNTTLKNVVEFRLRTLLKYVMNLAEFQLS